jgi:hypothetical protein
MDSLLSAFFGAQVGRLQLAVAARLARADSNSLVNQDVGPSITKLVDAAQQHAQPLANAAVELGTKLDVSC